MADVLFFEGGAAEVIVAAASSMTDGLRSEPERDRLILIALKDDVSCFRDDMCDISGSFSISGSMCVREVRSIFSSVAW